MKESFVFDKTIAKPSADIEKLMQQFRKDVETLESKQNVPFVVMQDGKSGGYYVECHIEAKVAIPLVDINAALDPEEQEEFRLERELRPTHRAFLQMCEDAERYRQFSDIVAEYDSSYRPEIPLKILGGQHRTVAMQNAYEGKKVSRHHGFKIFFGLTMEQRNEIAQISNTNIAISLDLLDRMQETMIGPYLRNFCQKVRLLGKKEDFADRKNPEGAVTVRVARTFVVNFFDGSEFTGDTNRTFNPYVCRSGSHVDKKYEKLMKNPKVLSDKRLVEAGENFSRLHDIQRHKISKDPELRKYVEFKNKATSLAVVLAWSFVAGLLQKTPEKLARLYALPENSGKTDPLSAKIMSESKHLTDPDTYRGLGARTDKKDKGRLVQLFLEYSELDSKKGLTKELIDSAIKGYEANLAHEIYEKARKRVK
jgi:hypothetical protein